MVLTGSTGANAGWLGHTCPTHDPAPGSVVGRLSETGRLGLASHRSTWGGARRPPSVRCPPGPWRRTRRPEEPSARTPARLAGGGPPMAGHDCQSVIVVGGETTKSGEPQQRPGAHRSKCPKKPHHSLGNYPGESRSVPLEAYVFENWVSEIVRKVL